jgi:hypothetical protein
MIEVFKQMVEALEVDAYVYNGEKSWAAIQAGKQAIAKLESQKPFCYVYKENGEDFFAPKDGYYPADAKPLYTHPPQRTELQIKTTDPFESARVVDYNRGWNDCLFASGIVKQSQRTWQGLTDEEVKHEWEVWRANVPRYAGFAKGIEAKLKEKNDA